MFYVATKNAYFLNINMPIIQSMNTVEHQVYDNCLIYSQG